VRIPLGQPLEEIMSYKSINESGAVKCDGDGCNVILDEDLSYVEFLSVYGPGPANHYCNDCQMKADTKGTNEHN